MLTLEEYDHITEKFISYRAPAFRKDPDMIDGVRNAFMEADIKFDGTGVIEGYRGMLGKYKISAVIKEKKKKSRVISLTIMDKDKSFDVPYVPRKDFDFETMDLISILTPRQQRIIIAHFNEDKTLTEIAEELNVSVERIRQIMHRSLSKLREALNGQDYL